MKRLMALAVVAAVFLTAGVPMAAQAAKGAKKRAQLIREQLHRQEQGQKKLDRWRRNHRGAKDTLKARRNLEKWQLHHLAVDQKIERKREGLERRMYRNRLRHNR